MEAYEVRITVHHEGHEEHEGMNHCRGEFSSSGSSWCGLLGCCKNKKNAAHLDVPHYVK